MEQNLKNNNIIAELTNRKLRKEMANQRSWKDLVNDYIFVYGKKPSENWSNERIIKQLNFQAELAIKVSDLGYQFHDEEDKMIDIRNFVKERS